MIIIIIIIIIIINPRDGQWLGWWSLTSVFFVNIILHWLTIFPPSLTHSKASNSTRKQPVPTVYSLNFDPKAHWHLPKYWYKRNRNWKISLTEKRTFLRESATIRMIPMAIKKATSQRRTNTTLIEIQPTWLPSYTLCNTTWKVFFDAGSLYSRVQRRTVGS